MATAGIYKIENMKSKKVYIGSSIDIDKRFGQHRAKLKDGSHANAHLQSAWEKYGPSAFRFLILTTTVNVDCLEEVEQQFIDSYRERGADLYNIRPVANTNRGMKHSAQSRKNMSDAQKKRYQGKRPHDVVYTDEVRAKISAAGKGRVFSEETRAKISAKRKEYLAKKKELENGME